MAASQANCQEGKALNEKYYSDSHSDWTYYNSDYYYQCNETNAALRESVQQMIENGIWMRLTVIKSKQIPVLH